MYPCCTFERLLLILNTVNKAIVSLEPGVHLYSRPQHSKLKTKKCRCPYKSISGHQQIELHRLGADSGSPHPAQLLATLNGIGLLPVCPPLCFAVTTVHKKAWMDAAVAYWAWWLMPAIIAFLGLRQEDFEFKDNFRSTMRHYLKIKEKLTTYISIL